MTESGAAKMLLIFIDETDMFGEVPLYEAILRRLAQLDIGGATVNAGIMGFGTHHQIHRKRLFGMPDDRPVTIAVIDREAKIRGALEQVRPMVEEGLVVLVDCEVIA